MKQCISKVARLLISFAPTFAFGAIGCGAFIGEAKIPESIRNIPH
jgi:hypothetical protein